MEIRWLGEVELTVKYVALSPPAEEEEPLSDPFAGTGGSRLPALGWEPLWGGSLLARRLAMPSGEPSKGPSRRALKIRGPRRQEGGPARHRDGGCGLGDSDRRWASRKFRQHPLPKVAGQL